VIVEPKSRESAPPTTVFLLHGYGSCGENMTHLAQALSLPNVTFVCPDGPELCQEYSADRQWFSLKDIDWGRSNLRQAWEVIADPLSKAAAVFQDKLSDIIHHNEGDIVVAGFSQGAMMAYELGFFSPSIKAVIGLSGVYLLKKEPINKPAILWTHAQDDEVVPLQWMRDSDRLFGQYGLEAQRHISPYGGHSVTEDALRIIARFLMNMTSNNTDLPH
jgi:predicted esterase